jgi:hypothetical protein
MPIRLNDRASVSIRNGERCIRRSTVAFYRSLGEELSVGEAFRDGGDAVALHGLTDVFHRTGEMDLTLVS